MKQYIHTLGVDYLGQYRKVEPAVTQGSTMFLSDGTGGLIIDHLYLKTPTTIVDLTGGGGGGGTITGGTNLGAGSQVFANVLGANLQFRTLTAGPNITLTQNVNDIVITGTAGSSYNYYELITPVAPFAISTAFEYNEFDVTGAAGVVNLTLPNGTTLGQKMTLVIGQLDPGITINVALTLPGTLGTQVSFNALGQYMGLVWGNSSAWLPVSSGATVS